MPKADTSIDERGFRRFDKDGHPIAWLAPHRLRPDGGDAQGLCTQGHWWNQQNGSSVTQKRLTEGRDPRRDGSIEIAISYSVTHDDPTPRWRIVDMSFCAGRHYQRAGRGRRSGLLRDDRDWSDAAAREQLIHTLDAEGWRIWVDTYYARPGVLSSSPRVTMQALRVWCPLCVQETAEFEQELEVLRGSPVPA